MMHIKYEHGRETIGNVIRGLEMTGHEIVVDGSKDRINIDHLPIDKIVRQI
jgi:hypothetical protein